MTSKPVIECHRVTKSYHDGKKQIDVLKGIDLSVAAGESVAIVGASGAGKTTLLQILGGLDRPTSGVLKIDDQDLQAMNEKAKGVFRNHALGFIYQFHHLLPEFTALENVALPLRIRGLKIADAEAAAAEIIGQVGLTARQSLRIGALSGGERQRIAIVRALVTKPRCVLADEPTGNLDEDTAWQVFNVMMTLNETLNTSLIMVTHNRTLAKAHDRVLCLAHGQLQELED